MAPPGQITQPSPKLTSLGSNLYFTEYTRYKYFFWVWHPLILPRGSVSSFEVLTQLGKPGLISFLMSTCPASRPHSCYPNRIPLLSRLNTAIPLKAAATDADSVSLFINNKWIKKGKTADLVTDTLTADQYGEFWVKSVAWGK